MTKYIIRRTHRILIETKGLTDEQAQTLHLQLLAIAGATGGDVDYVISPYGKPSDWPRWRRSAAGLEALLAVERTSAEPPSVRQVLADEYRSVRSHLRTAPA